ncbi:D-cysteine desulfhydrase family protein [Mucisphaera calidilacus]|uniref:L-cysteate sulfo-lyase n=1 Tax=Mucisphaera calidilacus TaxID=2527982 RepID=A0A518BUY6_9BACT|nr:D-cysteine desulfhydrase family protein [Mucisphaera calidilacus]QDU70788.1 L-cysteate sulfo-lyase [Mucisphaera calidilacus]
MQLLDTPRFRLAQLPTPLVPAPRFSEALGGPTIYLKRDDLTGLAGGGNKTRKLEYSVGRALADESTDLITEGSIHSNHCRQTAAAARAAGLRCHLVLNTPEVPDVPQGNLLIDRLLGATCHYVATGAERRPQMEAIAGQLRDEGRRPMIIPTGASDAIGALGYAAMALELQHQLWQTGLMPDWIYTPSCSGGTHAGMLVGQAWYGLEVPIRAVLAAGKADEEVRFIRDLAAETAVKAGRPVELAEDVVRCDNTQVGPGYGIATEACLEAIRLLGETEGVLLDPVYSGKAMAGLIADVRSGRCAGGETVVFVHTGGQMSLGGKVDQLEPLWRE